MYSTEIIRAIQFLLTLLLVITVASIKNQENRKGKKEKGKDGLIWTIPGHVDPVKVGYIRELDLVPGIKHHMKTLSLDPPIFEIPGFLTSGECDRLIKAAKQEGLESSPVMDDPDEISSKTTFQTFDEWDADSDDFISAKELMNLPGKRDLYFTEEDIHDMFKELKMDKDGNGKIDFREFQAITVRRIKKYFNYVRRKIPRLRSRNSNQAWIWHDDPYDVKVKNLHQRLHKLTNLPLSLLRTSEPLQVVRYLPKGHYHCHHDSDELEDKPCCVYGTTENCRLCRYITVLYFLNVPLEGGETAFPLADNVTFDEEAWTEEAPRFCNLAKHCHDANIYVKPEKGKAIMWYNHKKDEETGWVGEMINLSYHGGCDVIRGVKWIANNWLNVIAWPGSWMNGNGWKNTLPDVMSNEFAKHKRQKDDKMDKSLSDEDEDDKEGSSAGEGDEDDDDSLLDDGAKFRSQKEEGDDSGSPEDEEGEEEGGEGLPAAVISDDELDLDETDSLNSLGDDYEDLGDSYRPTDDTDDVTIRRFRDEL